ncbi:uncharacterized protein [Ptychodera flava]|uniref:uncharacterized protein n=1 Tax=Ptychodera flava TaxID=63121 RepID=UPI00396A0073
MDCPFGKPDCGLYGHAYVICKPDVSLTDGDAFYAGWVRFYIDYGRIIPKFYSADTNYGLMVCKELGYEGLNDLSQYTHSFNSTNSSTVLNLSCLSESTARLTDCETELTNSTEMDNYKTSFVNCTAPFKSEVTGLLKFYFLGEWRFICDENWHKQDALVACKTLGKETSAIALHNLDPDASANIWMTNVTCTGSENNLMHCGYDYTFSCTSNMAAGVACEDPPTYDVYWPMGVTSPSNVKKTMESVLHGNAQFEEVDNSEAISLKTGHDWVDLGSLPRSCIEDFETCGPKLFTLSFWLKTGKLECDQPILEIGSDWSHGGITFEYVLGHFQVTLRHRNLFWRVNMYGNYERWSQLTFSCEANRGLRVFVDGQLVASDTVGKSRTSFDLGSEYRLTLGSRKQMRCNETMEIYLDELHYLEMEATSQEPINIGFGKYTTVKGNTLIAEERVTTNNAVDGLLYTHVTIDIRTYNKKLEIQFGELRSVSHAVIVTAEIPQSLEIFVGTSIKTEKPCGEHFHVESHSVFTQHCGRSILGSFAIVRKPDDQRDMDYLKISEIQLYSEMTSVTQASAQDVVVCFLGIPARVR